VAAAPPGCSVATPVTVSPTAGVPTPLTITTSVASLQSNPRPVALLLLLCLGLVPKQRRKLGLFVVLFALATTSACGNDNTNLGSLATTSGNYRVDVVATGTSAAGNFTATTSVTVVVPVFQ
jgi:hypothetical protein